MSNLVTGAKGFIGRHLAVKLGEHTPIPHHQICDWPVRTGDRVFFLSAYGNMAWQTGGPMTLRANVSDVLAMVEQIDFVDAQLIYVSTSSVTLPVQTPYSRAKRAAEEIILASGIRACIVRPFSVTGRGEQREHFIPTLIRSCLDGIEMDFVPDASHDYVDVEDVANGLIALADAGVTGIHEFGTGYPWVNYKVRELVESITGRKANVKEVPSMRSYDTRDWRCLAVSPFFKASKTLHQSVTEMVSDYEQARKTNR